MVGFDIRPMKGPDVARVAEIERICFITPWSYESLYKELKNKFAHYLVIEINGNIVGYGGMWIYLGEAHVTNIAVEPEFRRRGLARILMQSMMKLAAENKASCMSLEVRERNIAAQALYKSLGFKKEGVRKRYYSDTGEDAHIMWNYDIIETADV